MILEKGIIPPNANFESLNPKIDAEFLNIKVCNILRNPYLLLSLTCPAVSPGGHSMAHEWFAKSISELLWLWWVK